MFSPLIAEFSQRQQGTSQACASGQAVDPGNGIGKSPVSLEGLEGFCQVAGFDNGLPDDGGTDFLQIEFHIEDHPGEPHSAAGRPEQLRVLRSAAGDDFPCGQHQVEAAHTFAETARQVMVFPMHIAGDGAADGNVFRARRDRQKPAPGDKNIQYVGEDNRRLEVEQTTGFIEAQKEMIGSGPENVFAQGTVSVASAVAIGDQPITGAEDIPQFLDAVIRHYVARDAWIVAPAAKRHVVGLR
jgi:hypothetical protein